VVGTTHTDIGANTWLITDQPTHFRFWAASTTYVLPNKNSEPPLDGGWPIGSAEDCWLQLQDAAGRISRRHARLTYDHEVHQWMISDLQSKNGVTHDGTREVSFHVTPGVEVGIGGFLLIAESQALGGLRELLGRIIGWADERALDLAMRSVRMAATHQQPLQALQLCGDDDMVSIARLLHRQTLGDTRPFVVCERPRPRADHRSISAQRAPTEYDSGMAALGAAYGGTLCISHRHPRDFAEVVEACRNPQAGVQLIVCARSPEPSNRRIVSPIIVPPLTLRTAELPRIIDAYAVDAGAVPGGTLTAADRAWIRDHESKTLAKVQEATRRLVAIRRNGSNLTRAAAQLEMSLSALSEWVARRTFDIDDENSHHDD